MDKEAHSEHEGREPPFPTAPWVGAGRTPSVRALTRRPTREMQARQKKKNNTVMYVWYDSHFILSYMELCWFDPPTC